jgi:phosphate/sulfate permease
VRRNHRRRDHCRRRHVWIAGFNDPRAVVGDSRHHVGERLRLQLSTVRNIALAWVLTLPAAMVISGTLYWAFSGLF